MSNVSGTADRFTFDRLDDGLPLNLGALGPLRFHFIPLGDELNRYTLAIKNLPAAQYDIAAENRPLGHWSSDQLAQGVNLASATPNGFEPGGPLEAQAWVLRQLTDARSELAEANRNLLDYLPNHPDLAKFREQATATNTRIMADQRLLVQPHPYHFAVEPHHAKPAGP